MCRRRAGSAASDPAKPLAVLCRLNVQFLFFGQELFVREAFLIGQFLPRTDVVLGCCQLFCKVILVEGPFGLEQVSQLASS